MGKVIATISDDLEREFKKEIIDRHGKLRKKISPSLEEAIKLWLEKNE